MMADPKPLASLSPSLLARKGAARPAMRPQAYANLAAHHDDFADDLGWNDMGHDEAPFFASAADLAALPVHQQQLGLAQTLEAQRPSKATRAPVGAHGRVAFTLRLDPKRHLKLRLLSAVMNDSAQHIVTAALDAVLEAQSDMIAAALKSSPKGPPQRKVT